MMTRVMTATCVLVVCAVALAGSLVAVGTASAATFFTEDFSSNTSGPNLTLGPVWNTPNPDFSNSSFSITGPIGGRIYLGTNDTDYATVEFTAFATMTIPSGSTSNNVSPFMGFASSTTPDTGNFGEPPAQRLVVRLQVDPDSVNSSDDGPGPFPGNGRPPASTLESSSTGIGLGGGTHRVRMHWDPGTGLATFDVDQDYAGGPLVSDLNFVLNGADNGFNATNSPLIFGGGANGSADRAIFDDISVTTDGDVPATAPNTTFAWKNDAAGDWLNNSNWDPSRGAPPNDKNHTAVFAGALTASKTVFTDDVVTVNSIQFINTNGYNIAGVGSVNLAATTAAPPVNPSIQVVQGSHQFQVNVNLLADTTADVASGSTLSFNNTLNLMGNTLTKTGEGTVAIRNDLTLEGGTVSLQQGTIAGNGTVGGDLNNEGGTISPGNNAGSLSVVPEPSGALLLLGGVFFLSAGVARLSARKHHG